MAADDCEVDVLGDFDFKLEADSDIYDTNELPSKSANLLPEYTNPPWMLEQGWALDNSMDEKSKATIEKMLLEEQYYVTGRPTGHVSNKSMKGKTEPSQNIQRRATWTDEEKKLFHQGMEIYGRSWTKIAEIIPTRTSIQIKNFAHQYFKNQKKESSPVIDTDKTAQVVSDSVDPLSETVTMVTTAVPTVPCNIGASPTHSDRPKQLIRKKKSHVNGNNVYQSQNKVGSLGSPTCKRKSLKSNKHVLLTDSIGSVVNNERKHPDKSTTKLHSVIGENQAGVIDCQPGDIESQPGDIESQPGDKESLAGDREDNVKVLEGSPTPSHSLLYHQPDDIHIEGNLNVFDGYAAVVEVETGISDPSADDAKVVEDNADDVKHVEDDAAADDDNEEDVDIDVVDIENDDDDDANLILQNRSTSPNSVYDKLIAQAKQNITCDNDNIKDSNTDETSKSVNTETEHRNIDDSNTPANINTESNFDGSCKMVNIGSGNLNNDDSRKSVNIITGNLNIDNSSIYVKEESSNNGAISTDDSCGKIDNTDPVTETLCDGPSAKSDDKQSEDTNLDTVDECGSDTQANAQCDVLPTTYVNAFLSYDGSMVDFPIPTTELDVDPSVVTEEERKLHADFFEGRSVTKTPERYIKIRNFLLDAWKKSKPSYLRKTSVRTGLKNCGDVNCIGRVHAYLECIGAINFGCDEASYKHPRPIFHLYNREKSKDCQTEISAAKLEAMRPRKRKVKDAFGVWIDEKELEGQTIEHQQKQEKKEAKPPKPPRSVYDPFKLVPCLSFSDTVQAPFSVEIHNLCVCIMDIHSHISKTEVIGLLGGRFHQSQLQIMMAAPCTSISTGLQCEMDPVSQTQASENIHGHGLEVVGWYHSHPTFAPNPSVRDIETQIKFQDWFSKGGSHFVGVIVSPYNPRNSEMYSEVNCLTVSKEMSPIFNCNLPYKFVYTTRVCDMGEVSTVAPTVQDLASRHRSDSHRVDLSSLYSAATGVTCMDKMLQSVRFHYADDDGYSFVDEVRKIFSVDDEKRTSVDN